MKACVFRHLGGCSSPRAQEHHLLKQQRIRRAHKTAVAEYRRSGGTKPWSLSQALNDPRNLVGLCVGHHEKVTKGRLHIDPDPDAVMFAEEIGLAGSFEGDRLRRIPLDEALKLQRGEDAA